MSLYYTGVPFVTVSLVTSDYVSNISNCRARISKTTEATYNA